MTSSAMPVPSEPWIWARMAWASKEANEVL